MYNVFKSVKNKEVNKVKFLVIKGKIQIPGRNGLQYSVFDLVEFDTSKDIENQKRKYTWRKLYEVDKKNPWKFREEVWSRKRHIMTYNKKVLTTATLYDHSMANIFYGFIPIEELSVV